MSEADCELCRLAGLRTCDTCGGVSFEPRTGIGFDVCGWCRAATAKGRGEPERPSREAPARPPRPRGSIVWLSPSVR